MVKFKFLFRSESCQVDSKDTHQIHQKSTHSRSERMESDVFRLLPL